MALTVQISKVWPEAKNRNMFAVGVHMVLKDDAVTVAEETFTEETAKTGDPTTLTTSLAEKCQEIIDNYKAEKQINDHNKYDTLVSNVNSALVLE